MKRWKFLMMPNAFVWLIGLLEKAPLFHCDCDSPALYLLALQFSGNFISPYCLWIYILIHLLINVRTCPLVLGKENAVRGIFSSGLWGREGR